MTHATNTTLEQTDSRAHDGYRYQRFSPLLLLADMRFGKASLSPGDRLPEHTLQTTEGKATTLATLAGGRPIAIVTGSSSCPMTASAFPSLLDLERRYGSDVQFVLLAVREAHPGERIEQPDTTEKKLELARVLQAQSGAQWPVLVDDIDGTVHRLLDAKTNSLHLFDANGTLVFRSIFATDSTVAAALEQVATGQSPKSRTSTQLVRPMLKSAGYIDHVLRAAGRRAYRDVALSAPPMAVLGVLANAFPWLPKQRRGLGVAVLLGTVAAAATALAFLV